jgi:hypothetical protein
MEEKKVSSKASHRFAIASLSFSVIAMFGVVPLVIFLYFISCTISNWAGCTEIDYAVRFFNNACLSSIIASVIGVILGIIAHNGSEEGTSTRILASAGIGMVLFVFPLVLITGFLIWLARIW